MIRVITAFALAALVSACVTPPERQLLSTWYIVTTAKTDKVEHLLYLGLLNASDKAIPVAKLIINDEVVPSSISAARSIVREAQSGNAGDGSRTEDLRLLRPGEITFVRLGALETLKCRLPISVAVLQKSGDERAIRAESVNLMPTSIPGDWEKPCATRLDTTEQVSTESSPRSRR